MSTTCIVKLEVEVRIPDISTHDYVSQLQYAASQQAVERLERLFLSEDIVIVGTAKVHTVITAEQEV